MSESYSNGFAVYARNLHYYYTKSEPVLKGINLTVQRASIYGLLGSSGCGKTTLLKCILGRLKPKSGDIKIFGEKPGSPESYTPGAGVGYMPQELGLYFEFTIQEILTYFGRIYSMNRTEINEKVDLLLKLLQLPKNNKLIGKLSGGQQRRVSLACTLIHTPPLLILDEPTVGTDPVLRQNIWCHLMSLCSRGHTIIVTTHYIDEARNSKTVAFMRNGKILAEDDPEALLEKYLSTNLEDVFLKLCHMESEDSNTGIDISVDIEDNSNCYENVVIDEIIAETEERNQNCRNFDRNLMTNNNIDFNNKNLFVNEDHLLNIRRKSAESDSGSVQCLYMIKKEDITDEKPVLNSNMNRNLLVPIRESHFGNKLNALMYKNFKRITRNWGHLLFEIIFTSLLLTIVIISIGDGPSNLNLAVYDEEILNNGTDDLGQLFIKYVDKNIFNIVYYNTFDEAMDSVKFGRSHAAIDINNRFSDALRLRFLYLGDIDQDTLEESQIRVHLDRSNQLIGLQVERYLYYSVMDFIKEAANRSNLMADAINIPLVLEEPVYGDPKEAMKEFVCPGAFIALTFFTTAAVTAHLIHEERRDGLLERSLVAGITASEFLVSNLLTQFFILVFQIGFLLILPNILFGRHITGSITLVIGLLLSQGFCGVTFGLVVAVLISDTIITALTIIFVFFTVMVTGGVLWPIQNMPSFMQSFSLFLPNTVAIESMRNVMFRYWTIDYYEVYIGFVTTYVWFSIFVIIALISLRRIF